jgi:LPXTG-motif cell wall-anchored protein
MKARILTTGLTVAAVTVLVLLMAGNALAAPPEVHGADSMVPSGVLENANIGEQVMIFNPDLIDEIEPIIPAFPENPGDTPGDTPGDNPGDTPGDNPGDNGGDTPGLDDGGDNGGETPQTPPSTNDSGSSSHTTTTTTSKLPNTGTSLGILAAIALVAAGAAYVARRAAGKRVR